MIVLSRIYFSCFGQEHKFEVLNCNLISDAIFNYFASERKLVRLLHDTILTYKDISSKLILYAIVLY